MNLAEGWQEKYFAKSAPGRPEAEEGLVGWLGKYQNKNPEALTHFARAIELGSARPLVFQSAAELSWNDSKQAYRYMKRAVELDPDLKDGNYKLGTLWSASTSWH